ncbi:branched-chain amino acid aminotransferase, putative [Talaromyces stipitatus ATCC 10500]|uniref:Branched-chain amino acid aminotransferase, putative n=1 Tax=Talaromyces stipitatus (strain ATCC 10500 / CBS 375.48 / QM 6759 / NRRL 1006) TaxID=441959 RepID=B8MQ34_TALSN|nr:branched-chain amino acid aminotransferase, putative [Talaromyces stipitatus ATCC 10500]EED13060.1 branched-chain amino acid aminotransferase, putative [Talaromyces stipitatus ATCC 10500]
MGLPLPKADIEWNGLSALTEVNGHVQSRWNRETGEWSKPEFVSDPFLRVHGLAPIFNYGQGAFEGLKAFRGPNDNEINIFRPEFHALRMKHSASLVSIPQIPESHFLRCVRLAVVNNAEFVPPHSSDGMLYIRPVVFGSGPRILLSPTDEYTFCVYVTPASAYHGIKALDALILEEFDRAAPKGTGSAKVVGNYAPVMKWAEKAKSEGFAITLQLDSQTHTAIDEFSTSAFVGIKNEGEKIKLIIPESSSIIASATSDSIQQIARSFGWEVERRLVKYEELSQFSEVIACGTAATVMPIKSITMKSTADKFVYGNGSSEPGPIASKLGRTIEAMQKGRIKDNFGWITRLADI